MEQQDPVQSLAESSKDSKSLEGNWAQETTELSINDVTAPYEFRDGAYYCEGLDGGYISLDTLRRAWAMKVRAEKIKEARGQASAIGRASKNSEATKEKARKEYRKWQQTEIK